jgi:hypothetical protein
VGTTEGDFVRFVAPAVVDFAEWLRADGLEGVPARGVVLADADAAVERADVVGLAGVHADQHLCAVAEGGLDRTDGVHHVIGGGTVRRALAPGEDDGDG